MANQLTKRHLVEAAFTNALLVGRTEELERLNTTLQDSLNAASRDSEELRQTNATKDEVLGLVAHELRGPLTTILGNASILLSRRSTLEPAMVDLALEDIETDAKRLQRLIADLLVLARPDHDNPVPTESFDLYQLAQTTINAHHKAFPQREIILTTLKTETFMAAHRDYTEEVLINLLSNAEKYSPPEEAIEIRLRQAKDLIEVTVLDRGLGIHDDATGSIFQPFYRSPKTATKAVGLGLGLAVCKRLIEIQGGRIWVAPREGGGSAFAFTLPVPAAASVSQGSGTLA